MNFIANFNAKHHDKLNFRLFLRDEKRVQGMLGRIQADGRDHVHVIADYDNTLTRYWDKEKNARNMSSHGIFRNVDLTTEDFKAEEQRLYDHYYPIEVSTSLPMETKIIAMKEWTEAANKLIMGMGLKRGQIREMVRQAKPLWRDGIKEFMEVLKIKGIPLLVFSAGLGDLIQEIFNQSTSLPKLSSMHIVSNFMKFNKTTTTCSSSTSSSDDDDLVVVGFSEPVIHVFNKNEGHIDRKSSYFIDHVKGKRNVVLLGDSLGDPHMADGLEHDVVLKIGFCNRDEDKMLPIYLEKYDLVLTGDPGLHLVTDLLKSIL